MFYAHKVSSEICLNSLTVRYYNESGARLHAMFITKPLWQFAQMQRQSKQLIWIGDFHSGDRRRRQINNANDMIVRIRNVEFAFMTI